ncbi:DUF4033-containing protein [Aureococcus anophagefferens]|nr:DUF4033-containing protein [Aureococcus anophagefferens]
MVSPANGFRVEPLYDAYRQLFAHEVFRPYSAKLNAWVTRACSYWLMGASTVGDVETPDATWGDGAHQKLVVERCRFLEAGGCASACVNLCKIPTQRFFGEDMGLPLLMEPDYEDFARSLDRPRCHLVDDGDAEAALRDAIRAAPLPERQTAR